MICKLKYVSGLPNVFGRLLIYLGGLPKYEHCVGKPAYVASCYLDATSNAYVGPTFRGVEVV